MQISPHLCFDGQCREAIEWYQDILGGIIGTMLSYGESPMAAQVSPEHHGQILHATLKIGYLELTGVDMLPEQYVKPQGFFVTLSVDDAFEGKRIYSSLAEGGEIRVPFEPTFWSAGFGVLTDRFSIPWEINCEQSPEVLP